MARLDQKIATLTKNNKFTDRGTMAVMVTNCADHELHTVTGNAYLSSLARMGFDLGSILKSIYLRCRLIQSNIQAVRDHLGIRNNTAKIRECLNPTEGDSENNSSIVNHNSSSSLDLKLVETAPAFPNSSQSRIMIERRNLMRLLDIDSESQKRLALGQATIKLNTSADSNNHSKTKISSKPEHNDDNSKISNGPRPVAKDLVCPPESDDARPSS